jgi:hypothetical protein
MQTQESAKPATALHGEPASNTDLSFPGEIKTENTLSDNTSQQETTFFEMRKKMMDDWATFATSDPAHSADVVQLRAV